ncbi:MAG: hypothetical protein J6T03_05410, partial [Bacteroidales bacterium]|nr:hypothetical protein [Bacteroidales bacterium]
TTSADVFADAAGQSARRASVGEFGRWAALERNVEVLPWFYAIVALVVLVVFAVRYFDRRRWRQALLCLVVALAPLAWFLVVAQHSWEHYWFTYRILAITVMGVLMAVACMIDWQHVKIKKKDISRQ